MPSQTARKKSVAGIRAPRLERGKVRVAALLAAGTAVFAEKGYDAATMTEVAAKAGASIGSLYQFFPTKELLATALHEEMLDRLLRHLDDISENAAGRTAAELADRLLTDLLEFLVRNPAFTALADRRDIDKKRKQATRARLRRQIADLLSQASPPLSPERAWIMAIIVLHLMRAAISLSESDDISTRDTVLSELRRMLRAHLDSDGAA